LKIVERIPSALPFFHYGTSFSNSRNTHDGHMNKGRA